MNKIDEAKQYYDSSLKHLSNPNDVSTFNNLLKSHLSYNDEPYKLFFPEEYEKERVRQKEIKAIPAYETNPNAITGSGGFDDVDEVVLE